MSLARTAALPLASTVIVLTAAPAAAHVTISPEEATAGESTILTASTSHGCDGSPTTRLTIQLPEEVLTVAPTRNPSWRVRMVSEQLDDPVADGHGNEITERVAQVVYTAKEPLPDGQRDTFELSVQLPDTPGETLAFPVIQSCAEGETAWVETAEDGDADELDAPAPTVTLLAAENSTSAADSDDRTDDGGADTVAITALVAGLVGLATGVSALLLARRRR